MSSSRAFRPFLCSCDMPVSWVLPRLCLGQAHPRLRHHTRLPSHGSSPLESAQLTLIEIDVCVVVSQDERRADRQAFFSLIWSYVAENSNTQAVYGAELVRQDSETNNRYHSLQHIQFNEAIEANLNEKSPFFFLLCNVWRSYLNFMIFALIN